MVGQRHQCRLFGGKIMTGHLIVSDEDATRVITLRRPEKKNAITQDMYRAMSDAIDTAQNRGVLCAQEWLAPLSPSSSPRRSLAQTRRVCRRQ